MAKQTINNLEAAGSIRKKINDNFTELYNTQVPMNHSFTDSRYGAASEEVYGHIKVTPGNGLNISDGTLSIGLASTAAPGSVQLASSIESGDENKAVTASQAKTLKNSLESLQGNSAPKNHASGSTIYGAASTSNYGHIKVTNSNGLNINNGVLSINAASTNSFGTVQLEDTLSSQSSTRALTAKQGYLLDQKKPDVFYGTSTPSSSIGRNGDIYFLID